MASFSRGLSGFLHQHSFRLPSSIRVALFSARSQSAVPLSVSRCQTSIFLRHYVRPSKVLQAATRAPARATGRQGFMHADPMIRAVLQTKQPVLLYKAPDRRLYTVGVYALACTLVGAGLWVLKFRYDLPEGLAFFVGPTYVVVAFIMFAIAAYIFSAPVARCSSIELIPSTLGNAGVQLRIKARTVPWSSDKVIVGNIGEATIHEKTRPITMELIEAERARKQSITEGLEGMFIARRMWEIAARWIDQRWTSFFLRFKFAVLRFGIVKLKIHGDTWKMDCTGYMREDGLALDRLIPVE